MNSKRKMIIAISALAMVILAAVVAVVAVLAAKTVTIQSSVNVTYEATDVYGQARISTKYEGDTNYTTVLNETDVSSISAQSLTLDGFTTAKKYVIIKFEFKKESATVENFNATLNYTSASSSNVTITSGTTEDATTTIASKPFNAVLIDDGTYDAFYIKIAITDVKQDASFAGSLNWVLTNVDA